MGRTGEAEFEVVPLTEHQLALALIARLKQTTGAPPVVADGQWWTYSADVGLWRSISPASDARPAKPLLLLLAALEADSELWLDAAKTRKGRCPRLTTILKTGIMRNAIEYARDDRFFSDAPPGLAVENGFVRLHEDGTVKLLPHRPEHRTKWALPIAYDPHAGCPEFQSFLKRTIPDDVAHETIAEFLGAALARQAWRYQQAIVLRGKAATGKSTLLKILRLFFPPEAVTMLTPQALSREFSRVLLANAAINMTEEFPTQRFLRSDLFNQIVDGSPVEAERKFEQPFMMQSRAAHIFACNSLPAADDPMGGLTRRLIIVPCPNEVPPDQRIPNLAETIVAKEAAGILRWALYGYARLTKRKRYTVGPSHDRELQRWKAETNSVEWFIEEHCTPNAWDYLDTLYNEYQSRAWTSGLQPVGKNTFYARLEPFHMEPATTKTHKRKRLAVALRESPAAANPDRFLAKPKLH